MPPQRDCCECQGSWRLCYSHMCIPESTHLQDDLVVDLDNVVAARLVVLALLAQLVLHHDAAPVHITDLLAAVQELSTVASSSAGRQVGCVSVVMTLRLHVTTVKPQHHSTQHSLQLDMYAPCQPAPYTHLWETVEPRISYSSAQGCVLITFSPQVHSLCLIST